MLRAAVRLSALACAAALTLPSRALAETDFGIQGFVFNGSHYADGQTNTFTAPAPFFQVRQRWKLVDIWLEGVPSTGGHSYLQTTQGAQLVTSLSIFDALAHVSLGPTGRYWIGGGQTVINQITALGSPPVAAASRLAGGRYEALLMIPAGRHGTIEIRGADMPSLHGAVAFQFASTTFRQNSEKAEAVDASAEYVVRTKGVAYGFGARTINYVAYFVPPTELADRNTAYGLLFEVRFPLAR